MNRFAWLVIAFLLFTPLFSTGCFAQDETIQINPTEIGESLSFVFMNDNDVSQKHLNAKAWVAKTFGDYKSVIQFEDDNNHKLILKGHSDLPNEVIDLSNVLSNTKVNAYYTLNFTITIDSRDDRFRILFEDIVVHSKSETYIAGRRHPEVDAERDRPVSEYCEPYVPNTDDIDKKQHTLDSLQAMLNSIPDNRRAVVRQKAELQESINAIQKNIDNSYASIERSIKEHEARDKAINDIFYGLVSTFKSAVEYKDEF